MTQIVPMCSTRRTCKPFNVKKPSRPRQPATGCGTCFNTFPLLKELEDASQEKLVGKDGQDSLLHWACRSLHPCHTAAVMEKIPREHWMKKNALGNTALHIACARGAKESIEVLLDALPPTALLDRNSRGLTPLHCLCIATLPPVEVGLRMIAAMPDEALTLITPDGRSLMHFAACGVEAVAEALLDRLGNVDCLFVKDTQYLTPLMCACLYGTTATLELLLARAGQEILRASKDGLILLPMLAERAGVAGELPHIEALCRAFATISAAIDLEDVCWSTCTLMHLLCLATVPSKLFQLALELLPHAALTAVDDEGVTPWILMANPPYTAAVVQRGKILPGSSTVSRAVAPSGRLQLFSQCLTPEERSVAAKDGRNALHHAIPNHLVDLEELLILVPPACALREDRQGELPLQKLSHVPSKWKPAVARLIELTAPALANSSTCVVTSLFEVFFNDHSDLLEQLLQSYPEGFLQSLPNDHWKRGISPLHSACSRPQTSAEKVEMLLTYFGAFASVPDAKGRTPLWHAAMAGNLEVARLLLPVTTWPLDTRVTASGVPESLPEGLARRSQVEALALILEWEPSLRSIPNDNGQTLLQAVEDNHRIRRRPELLQLLQPMAKRAQ